MSCLCKISFFFGLICACLLEAKVSVFSHYFGQPEFIYYQYSFFKKNLVDEYEFTVFEDSNLPEITEQIKSECEKYGIRYVRIPRDCFESPKLPILDSYVCPFSPSHECSIATQYIYDNFVVDSDDICLILDNDIFLLRPFSLKQFLKDASFSYVKEVRGEPSCEVCYMLPNFAIFNPRYMPDKETLNFNLGSILGNRTDSGGYTYFYLLKHDNLGTRIPRFWLSDTPSDLKNRFLDNCPTLMGSKSWGSHFFIEKDLFLHIRMGSNWSKDPDYPKIKQEVEFLFDRLLEEF